MGGCLGIRLHPVAMQEARQSAAGEHWTASHGSLVNELLGLHRMENQRALFYEPARLPEDLQSPPAGNPNDVGLTTNIMAKILP